MINGPRRSRIGSNPTEIEASKVEKKPENPGGSWTQVVTQYHPVERFVQKAYSIDCDEAPPSDDATRLEYPISGYVVDQVSPESCQLTWIVERANFRRGDEKPLLEKMAARLAAEAQLAVWCSQLEAVLEPLDSPRELCSNDSFDHAAAEPSSYPCHC